MKSTTTKLELKALAAAYRSASRNGHDFGFVEDVVKALRPMKAQAVGALLTSLSKKDILHVWEPVTTDSGTFTQFTWAEGVDLDYVQQQIARTEGMHPMTRICQDLTPRGTLSVQKIAKKPRTMDVTVINCEGTPTTTQLFQSDGQAAVECVRDYVRRGSDTTQTWYKPVIAAYVFDTVTKKLRTFRVDGHRTVVEL